MRAIRADGEFKYKPLDQIEYTLRKAVTSPNRGFMLQIVRKVNSSYKTVISTHISWYETFQTFMPVICNPKNGLCRLSVWKYRLTGMLYVKLDINDLTPEFVGLMRVLYNFNVPNTIKKWDFLDIIDSLR